MMASTTRTTVPEAEEQKNLGNVCFKDKHYQEAIDHYTAAIELDETNPIYWSNRAFAYLKTEAYGYALIDSTKSIEADPSYVKGYYRRASANMALNKPKESLADFKQVVKVSPRDKNAQAKLKHCKRLVTQIMFAEAISSDKEAKSVEEEIHLDTMTVDANYSGPRLPEEGPNEEFLKELIAHFKDQKRLHKRYAYDIVMRAKALFTTYPSLVDVSIPADAKFTICGDTHGQFYDLLNIFEVNGFPGPTHPYLFNGDFVDRGSFSFEVIVLLFTLKLIYPDYFFMARGNHESVTMNRTYGFDGEVKAKGTELMMELFHETFRTLPLCHVIEKKIFCVHGGLFNKDGVTLDDIRKINRFREPSDSGLMCDILWADPMPQLGRAPSKRGVGLHFGPDVTEAFLKENSLDYVVRSHEVKDNGYEVMHNGKCITVFSAPNYCDQMGNKGALINIFKDDLSPKFVTFMHVPHPDVKPMAYAQMNGMFDF